MIYGLPEDAPIRAWPFAVSAPINSSAIQERLQYLTEIQTSRSGREYRLARRATPRKRLSFAAVLSEDELPLWQSFIHDALTHNLVIPQHGTSVPLEAFLPAGSESIALAQVPEWVVGGMAFVMGDGLRREAVIAEQVGAGIIDLARPAQRAWPAGTPLYAGLVGVLDQAHQAELIAPDVASVTVDFRVRPLTEAEPEPPAPEAMFDGREVLLARPTWSGPLSQAFSRDVDELDYGIGPIARYSAVPFAHDVIQARYVQAHAEEVLATYHRSRGRQGEFFAPTWMPDLRMRGDASGSSLRVRGPEMAERYSGSLTHRAVFLHMRDGQTLLREVSGLSLVNDSQGQDTVMTLTEPLDVPASDVVMAGWLLLRRFASDELVIEHYPTGAMSLQAGLMTLEMLPEETV